MWIRIVSAVLGIPLIIFIIFMGRTALTIALSVVTLIGLWEFYNAFKKMGLIPFSITGMVSGALIIIATGVMGKGAANTVPIVLVGCIMTCFVIMILKKSARVIELGITLLGIVYVALLLNILLQIYIGKSGVIFFWLVFVLAWSEDTAAYFVGINLGKHKLCPSISPNKSVEGALGGLMGSIIGSMVLGYTAFVYYGVDFRPFFYVLLGILGGAFAQLGDLSASLIKRYAGVKDYGNIIPGHGGILDRFDSILFTAPIVYWYIEIFF
ncbi:MAG: Phosphatidate cytidylyltransferase [Firmicutes bacterium]|nr:Phosphatidate cytidylyltransferase [Bacillota bacterium]MDI6704708.1 phosphatidate cytidylyltransferase [Bacillota bacterium]